METEENADVPDPMPPSGRGDSSEATGEPDAQGTPQWVKVAAIIALVLVALVLVMLLVGGDHGPGRH
jgi:hypothetical protein